MNKTTLKAADGKRMTETEGEEQIMDRGHIFLSYKLDFGILSP